MRCYKILTVCFVFCFFGFLSAGEKFVPKNSKRAVYLESLRSGSEVSEKELKALELDWENPPISLFERNDDQQWQDFNITVETLKLIDKHKLEGISFDYDDLIFNQYGTCSAMSLDFISRCLAEQKLNPNRSISEIVSEFVPIYEKTNETFISRQAAFNSIKVDPSSSDLSDKKIQTLASYHGMVLTPVSDLIVNDTSIWGSQKYLNSVEEFAQLIDDLPEGCYVIRAIQPKDNKRLESYGHTMSFVLTNDGGVFFDPGMGASFKSSGVGSYISDAIFDWFIPEIRLYSVSSESSIINLSKQRSFPEGDHVIFL